MKNEKKKYCVYSKATKQKLSETNFKVKYLKQSKKN